MDPTAKPGAPAAPRNEAEYLDDLRRRWQAAWPPGAPREPQYPLGRLPLSEMLRHWARIRPQQTAVHFYGHVTSYAELDAHSDRCAALLGSHGIGPGDRVAVLLPNCPQFHAVFFGILKLGAIYVPVSPLSQHAELLHALRDSTPCALVALDQLLPLVADAREELGAADPLRNLFVTSYADVAPASPTLPLPPMVQAPRLVPEPQDRAIDLLPAMAACNAPAPQSVPDIDAPAALNYTGGTTGLPKGCIHTQGDMVDMAAAFGAVALPIADDSVMLGFFPRVLDRRREPVPDLPRLLRHSAGAAGALGRTDLPGRRAALQGHQCVDARRQRGRGHGAPARWRL